MMLPCPRAVLPFQRCLYHLPGSSPALRCTESVLESQYENMVEETLAMWLSSVFVSPPWRGCWYHVAQTHNPPLT